MSRDITARGESEESNRRLADELAHAARLATLGELASSIAHEMNQPLATIVNFASASQRYLKRVGSRPEYQAFHAAMLSIGRTRGESIIADAAACVGHHRVRFSESSATATSVTLTMNASAGSSKD